MTAPRSSLLAAAALMAALSACSTNSGRSGSIDVGPLKYDASGTMPCSRGAPDFKRVCGFRVVRKPGGEAEIWISNSIDGQPFYRVLDFAKGAFTTRDAAAIRASRSADTWTVNLGSEEHYRFPDAVITGG